MVLESWCIWSFATVQGYPLNHLGKQRPLIGELFMDSLAAWVVMVNTLVTYQVVYLGWGQPTTTGICQSAKWKVCRCFQEPPGYPAAGCTFSVAQPCCHGGWGSLRVHEHTSMGGHCWFDVFCYGLTSYDVCFWGYFDVMMWFDVIVNKGVDAAVNKPPQIYRNLFVFRDQNMTLKKSWLPRQNMTEKKSWLTRFMHSCRWSGFSWIIINR